MRWLRLDVGTLEYLLLSLVLGTVATCSIYPVLAWVGKPLLLWVWIFVAFLSLILSADTLFSRFQNAQIERAHFLLLLAILASWLPLYLLNFFFRNLTAAGQGAVTYFARIDVILHTSIAAELSHSIPPQLPWMAGLPLSYHVGMDLVASVLNRYTGLAVPDLVVRFCPVLFVSVDVLAVFCVARRFIGSAEAGVTGALLGVLGEDLSFVPGILDGQGQPWNAWYFQAPTVFSIYFINPMVAAHSLLFTALLCFYFSVKDGRRGWSAAAVLCSVALFETKIFVFVQLVLSLCSAGAVHLFFDARFLSKKPSSF